jgi:hypothetical protein
LLVAIRPRDLLLGAVPMNLREWLNRNLIDAPFDWLNDHPDVTVWISCLIAVAVVLFIQEGSP